MSYINIILIVLLSILIILAVLILILIIKKTNVSNTETSNIDENKIRETINSSFTQLQNFLLTSINAKLDAFESKIKELSTNLKDANNESKNINEQQYKSLTELIDNKFLYLSDNIIKNINYQFENTNKLLEEKIKALEKITKERMDTINNSVNDRLIEIEKAVDEKLEETLNEKLKQSFSSVLDSMTQVNIAVGEIKNMTKEVSSLRNVLTISKTRGVVGEVILGNLIKEILTTNQYVENVITKKGSSKPVEFAIKMPGSNSDTVFMPVDSKFPLEDYKRIKEAQEEGDKDKLQENRKSLKNKIKDYAKDIHEKYIDVPYTTDFGIMFLATEGLYAEAADMGLVEELQRDYRVVLVSPSTFQALLNALQVGFKTVSIQKKSVEISKLLILVKKEFDNFASVLAKTQESLDKASINLETLVGTRTRQLQKQLNKIETNGYIEDENDALKED